MPPRPLDAFLLRAPLLRVGALRDPERSLLAHPLGKMALGLAAAEGAPAASRRRFALRAAFRPTPSGLLAGVAMGRLGPRTRLDTGEPRAYRTASWAHLTDVGRRLLDRGEVRALARLRRAPSAMRSGEAVVWLGADDEGQAVELSAPLDDGLARVLDAAEAWTDWKVVREAASGDEGAADTDLDEWLLSLVDDGLLAHDLCPPLVGPPPAKWMKARLARLPPDLRASADDDASAIDGDASAQGGAHAVLIHQPASPPALSRRAVERAAAIAPLLFRLQEALAAPVAERDLATDGALGDALAATTEIFGAGALDLGALAAGDYGVDPGGDEVEMEPRAQEPAVVRFLVERFLAAPAAGRDEIALSSSDLDAVLPPAATPPTFELFLAPAREPRGAAPGSGWLLGLHAPAGATWGRFAHALGEPMRDALGKVVAAEAAVRPGERALDVAFAPSHALGDVCAHPPLRGAALALTSWPDGEAVTPAELELVADPSAAEPLALRVRGGGEPIAPSPLHRVRSKTAPPGVFRLLTGWALGRQHAPWALALGALADLEHTPRVTVDGFVVAPQSWRIPADVQAKKRGSVDRWRRRWRLPRWVQVGHEDELLPVDLEHASAAVELSGYPRAFEIEPRGAPVDSCGRRVEAVVAVVDRPDAATLDRTRAAIAASRVAGAVAPPRADPAPRWRTWKLFGSPARQDDVLVAAVLPAIAEARDDGSIDRWFFQRYEEGPGRRSHLRLRAHAAEPGGLAGFDARLRAAIGPARAPGDVVSIESAEYQRETARFGGAVAIDVADGIFEAESDLHGAFLVTLVDGGEQDDGGGPAADEGTFDPIDHVVQAVDALCAGFGLDREQRRALARRHRDAQPAAIDDDALAAEFRGRQKRLMAVLGGDAADPHAALYVDHARRVADLARPLDAETRQRILPTLLHLCAVRLGGAERGIEIRAVTFWERALEGLLQRARRR